MVGLVDVIGLLDIVGLLDMPGLLSVLGLLVLGAVRPLELLPLPLMLVDRVEPRGRVVLPTAFGLFSGAVNVGVGVRVVFRGLLTDDVPVESDGPVDGDETDEPVDDDGAQLTPGVIVGDGLVAVVDLVVEAVPVVPVRPVVPLLPVVCANAGAVLKAIAHARPAPLRIGIFSVLISILILIRVFLLS